MPPSVKVRIDYTSDGAFLTRMRQAVEKDKRISFETQQKIHSHLGALITILIDADKQVTAAKQRAANGYQNTDLA